MTIDPRQLQNILAEHLPVFAVKAPHYQVEMLDSLLEVWQGRPQHLLDVGGGTGVIAQAIADLFPVASVEAIDLIDRFCPTLKVPTRQYDGRSIPCADGSYDAATLNNVIHHVPPGARADLMREIRRAVAGPVYIKDHLTTGFIDDMRLTALDAWGNIPFGGMVKANYLSQAEWDELARASGYRIGAVAGSRAYRTGFAGLAFPNRLETTMRFDPA
ncbi:MAG TPA: class I SAM-dependent methyltransferase [Sphingopyxis sp.]|nr:class I SAM-dependent methyltransferase [Sphingopyxis sp.]